LLLAQIYAGALKNAGATNVTVRPPVGSREVVVKALQDKSLSVVPDYSGNLLRYFDKDTQATTPQDVYTQLKAKVPAGFEVLDQAPAEDKDLLVVGSQLASSGVKTFSDLGKRCGQLVLGGPGQWSSRWKDKIKTLYGCEFKEIRTTDTGGPVTVAALKSGDVQVVDLFSTSSTIKANGFVALTDDKNMFPAQNIVPLIAKGTLSPAEAAALNRVSAALTTDQLTQLNVEFTEEKRNPLDIAEDFLARNNLKA
jgi:osmoprotectant transport system substrate-binding protein